TITDNGTLTTIASVGNDLVFDSGTGKISIATGDSLQTAGGYDLTSGTILREVQPIFGFDVPIRCSTSCDDEIAQISCTIQEANYPAVLDGTAPRFTFTIQYADTASGGTSTWSVLNAATDVAITTFRV